MTMKEKNRVSKKWLLAAADFEAENGHFSVSGSVSTDENLGAHPLTGYHTSLNPLGRLRS